MAKKKKELAGYDFTARMRSLQDEMNKAFREFWNSPTIMPMPKEAVLREPLIRVHDKGARLCLSAELPGVDKKSIRLNIDENSVSISARKTSSSEAKSKKSYYSEYSSQSFFRKIPLPAVVKPQTASWKFENGLLSVEIEKKRQTRELPSPK